MYPSFFLSITIEFVQPICLPMPGTNTKQQLRNRWVKIAGWGEYRPNTISMQLQVTWLKLWSCTGVAPENIPGQVRWCMCKKSLQLNLQGCKLKCCRAKVAKAGLESFKPYCIALE